MAIWARKLIFSTTDLIFPGFYNATDGKKNEKIYRKINKIFKNELCYFC
jgi:hypothetical protein